MDTGLDILKKNSMLFALIVATILFEFLTKGKLLVPQNVTNLLSQNGYVVILAIGMLMCILTGGNIDLSVGSVVCLLGAIAGQFIVTYKANIFLSMIICIIAGIIIGAWHGYWIAYIRIPAFIVTLSGMLLWRGVALKVLNGLTISPFPTNYLSLFNNFIPNFSNSKLNVTSILIGVLLSLIYIFIQIINRNSKVKKGYKTESFISMVVKSALIIAFIVAASINLANYKGIPVILIILAVIAGVYTYYTTKTVPGRYLYAMGGNEKAARLSGINTNRVLFLSYVNMGFLCAIAALVCVARFNSAAPTAGTNYELDAIGACFIGGASAYGGIGTVGGTVIGAIFMGVLNNGMSIMGADSNDQRIIKGLVLLAAVAFDVLSKKKNRAL
ncbi:MAG: sugar ABC transporter permease [Oscillospiraceae bacterium]|nr:sugar ABC transporter permease [Oscillospiraceae bacterium]